MQIFFCLIIALVNTSPLQYPEGWVELQSDNGWELVSENNKAKTYRKKIPKASLPAIKVEIITDANPQKLINKAWDVNNYTKIFSGQFITEAQIDTIFDINHYAAWEKIEIPFLSPRIYYFESIKLDSSIHWIKVNPPQNRVFKKEWLFPKTNFGSWEISTIDGNTSFIYRICVEPGGSVPDWIVELAYQMFCQYTVIDLEKSVINH